MLYLKHEALLLTDMFLNYINACKSSFVFGPFFYITPKFTKDAGLKYTRVKPDSNADDKLRTLFENKIKCGPATLLGNRYVKRKNTGKKTLLGF